MFATDDQAECKTLAANLILHSPTKNLGELGLNAGRDTDTASEKVFSGWHTLCMSRGFIEKFSINETAAKPAHDPSFGSEKRED